MTQELLTRTEATPFILDALERAHGAEPFVGGLFHAYEKALHFALLTECYRRGLWKTRTERPYPKQPHQKCDLVLPFEGKAELWLEAKLIWFAFEEPFFYKTQDKYLESPVDDWKRLREAVQSDSEHPIERSVLVLLAWDNSREGRRAALAWREERKSDMARASVAERSLREFPCPGSSQVLSGELILWSSV